MTLPDSISASIQDYAKAVYVLEAREGAAVSTNELAERLGVTPGSVSAMVRKLSEAGLVEHEPYHGVRLTGQGRREEAVTAVRRGLAIAEAASATALIPRMQPLLAYHHFLAGQMDEGFALLRHGRALAESAGDGEACVLIDVYESDALLKTARVTDAAEVARRGLASARQAGLEAFWTTAILAGNGAEALLYQGRTAEAAALIGPLTDGPAGRDTWLAHVHRAEIDLLSGDAAAAIARQEQIAATVKVGGDLRPNHSIATALPLCLPDAELPLPPYVLGAWLGDGSSSSPDFTSADPEIAMLVEGQGLEARGNRGRELPAQGLGALDHFLRIMNVGRRDLVHHFHGRVPQHALGPDIEELNDTLFVGGDDREVGASENRVL